MVDKGAIFVHHCPTAQCLWVAGEKVDEEAVPAIRRQKRQTGRVWQCHGGGGGGGQEEVVMEKEEETSEKEAATTEREVVAADSEAATKDHISPMTGQPPGRQDKNGAPAV